MHLIYLVCLIYGNVNYKKCHFVLRRDCEIDNRHMAYCNNSKLLERFFTMLDLDGIMALPYHINFPYICSIKLKCHINLFNKQILPFQRTF